MDEIVTVPDEQIFEALVWTMHYAKVVQEGARRSRGGAAEG